GGMIPPGPPQAAEGAEGFAFRTFGGPAGFGDHFLFSEVVRKKAPGGKPLFPHAPLSSFLHP
uniref:hypothetical protein n=1 Tax=uncultured Bilophila sp. TaxID=529385 RepID=UPI0025EF908F